MYLAIGKSWAILSDALLLENHTLRRSRKHITSDTTVEMRINIICANDNVFSVVLIGCQEHEAIKIQEP